MQVETSIDEADVGRIRVGQRATFTVDAFPGRTFNGEVHSVRKAAQNVQNVVTYIAIVSANNDRGELLPGMTANVRIVTDTRESVLKVPNGALRFRPPGPRPGTTPPPRVPKPVGQRGQGGHWWQPDDAVPRAAGDGAEARCRAATAPRADLRGDAQQVHGPARHARGGACARPARRSAPNCARRSKTSLRAGPEGAIRARSPRSSPGARAAGQTTRGRVWLLDDGKPRAIDVRVGLSDGVDDGSQRRRHHRRSRGHRRSAGRRPAAAPAQKGAPPRMFF